MLNKLKEFELALELADKKVKDIHKKFPKNNMLGSISSNLEEIAEIHIKKARQQEVYLAKYGQLLKDSDAIPDDKLHASKPEKVVKIEIARNMETMLGFTQDSFAGLDKLPMTSLYRLEAMLFQLFVSVEENGASNCEEALADEERASTSLLDNESNSQFQEIENTLSEVYNDAIIIRKFFRKNKTLNYIQNQLKNIVEYQFDLAKDAELFSPSKALKGASLAKSLEKAGVSDISSFDNKLELVKGIEVHMGLDSGDFAGLEIAPVKTLQMIYQVVRQEALELSEPDHYELSDNDGKEESIKKIEDSERNKWDGWHVSGHGPFKVRLVRRTDLDIEEFSISTKTYWNEIGGKLPFVKIIDLEQEIFDEILEDRDRSSHSKWHILSHGPLTVVLIGWVGEHFNSIRISTKDFWDYKLDRLPRVRKIHEHPHETEKRKAAKRKLDRQFKDLAEQRKEEIGNLCGKLDEIPPDMEKMTLQELDDLQASLYDSLQLQVELKQICEEIGRSSPQTESYTKKELEATVNVARKLLVVCKLNSEVSALIGKLDAAYGKLNKSQIKNLVKAKEMQHRWCKSFKEIQLENGRNNLDSIRKELISAKSSLEELGS